MRTQVHVVPCLRDNYAYLVHVEGSRQAIVVDPSEAEPVEEALAALGLELAGVLDTHHHHDHVGGNVALAASREGLPVVASEHDKGRVPAQTRAVNQGDKLELAGLPIEVFAVPGHTLGAVAFLVAGEHLFTGDTLFVAGCGRLFEGTPAQMDASLSDVLGKLPDEMRVYCGHEYTESNLRFAKHVDPDNAAVDASIAWASALRAKGEPTVPSTLGRERAHNPFLRVRDGAFAARFAPGGDSAAALAVVRRQKDVF